MGLIKRIILVAVITTLFTLSMVALANGKPVTIPTHPVCNEPGSAGVTKEAFYSDRDKAIKIDGANINTNKIKFMDFAVKLVTLFDAAPPYRVDEIEFFEMKNKEERDKNDFYLAVFSYGPCVQGWARMPITTKKMMFGEEI